MKPFISFNHLISVASFFDGPACVLVQNPWGREKVRVWKLQGIVILVRHEHD